ncbi:EpsG family protein [Vibrio parahaemolyticus]|uniref:Polysaccharide polymerase n=2 Tax=Vibrio parahaemolyticus TaxID=670 RepID=A0A5P5X5K8_VIBPH|nr:EpsG family protein [Vibrio parahaemolyticus]EHA6958030.1 EpsG family protein [Vibrio parahaemolyticus]EHA6972404.1 EpsG family protein [Vibrio parahaemolyticus]EIV8648320.1 EpsG family protein [Vibrio parahaemolyticus]EJE4732020.1 EpsG family protein [Vibrio parahaemolyticus]MCD2149298.1 EpsG family protein [Vibrio parahaemolyticus]
MNIRRHTIEVIIFGLAITIIASLISGLRYESGADYFNYERIFFFIKEFGYKPVFEPFFFIIYSFSKTYYIANIAMAIITNLLMLLAINKCTKKNEFWFAIFIYFFSEVYLTQFNIVRQSLALPFLYLFYVSICDKCNKRVVLYFFLSISCHFMAGLICFILIFLRKIRINSVLYLPIAITVYLASQLNLFLGIYQFFVAFLPEKFSGYLDMDFSDGKTLGTKFIIEFTMFYVVTIFLNKSKNINIRYLGSIVFVGYLVAFVATTIPILFRLAYFLIFFKVIYFSKLLSCDVSVKLSNRVILIMFICLYHFLMFYYYIDGNLYDIFPYAVVSYDKIF